VQSGCCEKYRSEKGRLRNTVDKSKIRKLNIAFLCRIGLHNKLPWTLKTMQKSNIKINKTGEKIN
jgi:hypothetical protein